MARLDMANWIYIDKLCEKDNQTIVFCFGNFQNITLMASYYDIDVRKDFPKICPKDLKVANLQVFKIALLRDSYSPIVGFNF